MQLNDRVLRRAQDIAPFCESPAYKAHLRIRRLAVSRFNTMKAQKSHVLYRIPAQRPFFGVDSFHERYLMYNTDAFLYREAWNVKLAGLNSQHALSSQIPSGDLPSWPITGGGTKVIGIWPGFDLLPNLVKGYKCDRTATYQFVAHHAGGSEPMDIDGCIRVKLPLTSLCNKLSKSKLVDCAAAHAVFLNPRLSMAQISRELAAHEDQLNDCCTNSHTLLRQASKGSNKASTMTEMEKEPSHSSPRNASSVMEGTAQFPPLPPS